MRSVPMAMPLLWFTLGIVLADSLSIPAPAWVAGSGMALLLALWRRGSVPAAAGFLLLAGGLRLVLEVGAWSPVDLRRLTPEQGALAVVRGRLLETPVLHESQQGRRTQLFSTAVLETTGLRDPSGEWRPATGLLLASVRGGVDERFFQGERVELTGVLGLPDGPETPGAFDYQGYLCRCGIHRRLQSGGTSDWALEPGQPRGQPPVSDRFLSWGRHTLARGFSERDPAIQLLWAMMLGWKPGLSPEMQEPFLRSGTIHVFAISGLHIALLAGIFIEGLRLTGLPRRWAGGIALPWVWVYTAITGWQASAIRSAVMWSLIALGWGLRRPGNLLNSLALAAFLLLAWDPQQLFLPGFQLSFVVVASLALLARPLTDRGLALTVAMSPSDPLLAPVARPRWHGWIERGRHHLVSSLAVSLASWIGSMPLVAFYFHYFNPVSLLANLVVVPLSTLALSSSVASLATGGWFPAACELFNHSSWFLMHLMVGASELAAALPGGCLHVAAPGACALGLYGLGCLWMFCPGAREGRWRGWMRWATLLLLAGWGAGWVAENRTTRISVLPRRGGAILWVAPAWMGSEWLFDPGDARTVERVTLPFLRSEGVNRVAHLVLGRGGVETLGGALDLEQRLWVGDHFFPDIPIRSPYLRRWRESLQRTRRRLLPLVRGNVAGPWEVLHPGRGEAPGPAGGNRTARHQLRSPCGRSLGDRRADGSGSHGAVAAFVWCGGRAYRG